MIVNIGLINTEDNTALVRIIPYPESRSSEWFFKSPKTGIAKNNQLIDKLVVDADLVYSAPQKDAQTSKSDTHDKDKAFTVSISEKAKNLSSLSDISTEDNTKKKAATYTAWSKNTTTYEREASTLKGNDNTSPTSFSAGDKPSSIRTGFSSWA